MIDVIDIEASAELITFEQLEKTAVIVLRSDSPAAARRFAEAARAIALPEGKKLPAIPILVIPRECTLELLTAEDLARCGWYRKEVTGGTPVPL